MDGAQVIESPLVERDAEVERLESVLLSVSNTAGRLVVIEGAPGIGKSTLLSAVGHLATDRGFRVLTARGHPIESDLSFGIVRQLFERVITEMSEKERAEALAGAAELALSVVGSAPGAEPSLFPAMHGLHWLTANLTDRQPLLLMIDDAHWADGASLQWLTYLSNRLEDVRAVVLLARWPHSVGPPTPTLDTLTGARTAEVIGLHELTRDGVAELAGAITGEVIADDALDGLLERSGGNPFFVRELLIHAGDGSTAVVPDNVARFASTRVGALSADARGLAAATAILGPDGTLPLAASLAELSTASAEVARDELARAGIFSTEFEVGFVHPLIREAVYSDLPSGERARLHRRAVTTLTATNADVERRAVHLLSSTPDEDSDAILLLREAASRARSRGDNQAASAYLERARAEGGAAASDHLLLLELGTALSLWNPTAAVEPLEAALAAAPDADARLIVAIDLAQNRIRLADLAGAYDVFERALEDKPARTDPDLLLAVEGGLLTIGGLAPQLLARARERLKRVVAPAGDTPGERLLLSGIVRTRLTDADSWHELIGLTRRAVGGGKLLTDHAPDAGAFTSVVWPFMMAGLFEEAWELTEDFFADAARRGSLVNVALATHFLGTLSYFKGDINAALEYSRDAIERCLSSGYFVVLPTAVGFHIRALIQVGRIDEGAELLKAYGLEGEIPDLAILFHTVLHTRAELRLAQGRPEDALTDLEDLARRHAEFGIDEETLVWRPLASEANLLLGRRDEAVALATAELERTRCKGVIPAEVRALTFLARAVGGAEGIEYLREALALPTTFELDRARALAELGRALLRRNRSAEAQGPLLEALDLASRLGASVLATSVTADLRASGARPRRTALTGADSLTPSERRVADLAAVGHTNVEIAQRLFVTRKSVEFHLTNVYRKLGVGTRRDLAASLQPS